MSANAPDGSKNNIKSNFSDLTSTAAGAIGSGAATIDNHVISVTGGDPGSSITGQYVTTLSVD